MSFHMVSFFDDVTLVVTVKIALNSIASGDENDSNLLTSEHDVISGVLREEFGPSYEAVYGFRFVNCIC